MLRETNPGAGAAAPASFVIDLLDSDDDSNSNSNDVIDLCSKPAAIQNGTQNKNRVAQAPIWYDDVQVLETPQDATRDDRKPEGNPTASNRKRKRGPVAPRAAEATVEVTSEAAESPILRVLEIFPDADVDYVKKKLREQKNNFQIVVALLSESNDYPKQKKNDSKAAFGSATTNGNIIGNNNNTIIRGIKTKEPKHDYSSTSAPIEISEKYRLEVVDLLMYDFAFLKKKTVQVLLKSNHERYTLTRNHIQSKLAPPASTAAAPGSAAAAKLEEEENSNYNLLRAVLVRGAVPREVRDKMGKHNCLRRPRSKIGTCRPTITDAVLVDEHFHFEQKFKQWLDRVQSRLKGQAANKLALENGSAVQCNCCFDDVALSECVPCKEEGHLFCKDCIVQYVESQVFGSGNLGIDKITKKPALEIKCCEGSGCNSGFQDGMLRKVLPPKTWEKYSEMQIKAQLSLAGLGENLAMCPKCGYQAEVPEMQNSFACPVEWCRFVSCRKCGKAEHIPLRCEEVVKKDRNEEGRHKIEEALSEAKMRTCPKCSKKFIKSDGCNKMTCPCGVKMCYVCRQPLDKHHPYKHFCQVPHCDHKSCGKCRLYTNDEEDDALAMREAGIAAKQAYEAKLQNEDVEATTVDDLELNVDEMMRDPSKRTTKRQRQMQVNQQRQAVRHQPRQQQQRRDLEENDQQREHLERRRQLQQARDEMERNRRQIRQTIERGQELRRQQIHQQAERAQELHRQQVLRFRERLRQPE